MKKKVDRDLIIGEISRKSLKHFITHFWEQIEPMEFESNFYIDAICEHLTHIHEIKRLLINIPARHTKSTLISVMYPAWLWLHEPEQRLLTVSYALALSQYQQSRFRMLIESPLYQKCFGSIYQIKHDQNTKIRVDNNRSGFRLATSPDSSNTGFGGSIIY